MRAKGLWVELRYGFGERGIPLGRTTDRGVIRAAKEALAQEAVATYLRSRDADPVVAALQKLELRRIEEILSLDCAE